MGDGWWGHDGELCTGPACPVLLYPMLSTLTSPYLSVLCLRGTWSPGRVPAICQFLRLGLSVFRRRLYQQRNISACFSTLDRAILKQGF